MDEPRDCPKCDELRRPVILAFVANQRSGWFLVCPDCHHPFAEVDPNVLGYAPRNAPPHAMVAIDPRDVRN